IIDAMPTDWRDTMFYRLAADYAETGNVEAARARAEQVAGDKGRLWSAIALADAAGGDFIAAIETFQKVESPFDQASCAKELAAAWSRTGQRAEAWNWASSLTEPYVRASALL